MPSNIEIKITAETTQLAAQLAIARSETAAFTRELNTLAKQAASTGLNDTLKAQMVQVSEQLLNSKNRVAELSAQMRTAGGDTSVFSGALTGLVPLVGALGIATGAAGLIGFAKEAFDAAAAVQKEADALEISAEAFQAYQFAARESGVDTDTATTALKRFVANLGELQKTGTGPMADDLRELGLTADELAGDPTQALITLARAWDKLTDVEAKAAIERDFFGRSGVDLTAMLHNLAQGSGDVSDKWKEFADRARDAGEMMDPKLTEAAKKAEIEMDSFATRLKAGVALALREVANDAREAWNALARPWDQLPLPKPKGPPQIPVPAPTFLKPEAPDVKPPDIEIAKAGGGGDKAANEARRAAEAVADAWRQSNTARIEGEQTANTFLLEMGRETIEQFTAQARDLENQRYAIELEGLHKREAADAKDKAALAKDKADEAVVAQQHANRLAAIDEDYARKKKQIDDDAFAQRIAVIKVEAEIQKAALDEALAYDQITGLEHVALSHQVAEKEIADEIAVLQARRSIYAEGTPEYRKYTKQIEDLSGQLKVKQVQDAAETAREVVQHYQTMLSPIESGFGGLISSMINRTQSLVQAVRQAALQIVDGFAQMGVKALFHWIAAQLGMTAATKVQTATDVATTQAGEIAKTGAVAAGAAARTTIQTTAAGVGNAAEAAADSTSIINSAYTAAASVFKWVMQEVPFPLNVILAPVAAAGTFAAVAAFNVIKSAAGGQERVLSAEQLTVLHRDESVLPARISRPLMELVENAPVIAGLGTVAGLAGQSASAPIDVSGLSPRRVAQLARIGAEAGPFIGGGARTFDGSLAGGLVASASANLSARPIDLSGGLSGNLPSRLAGRMTIPETEEQVNAAVARAISASGRGDTHVRVDGPHINISAVDANGIASYHRRNDVRQAITDTVRDAVRRGGKLTP